MSSESSPVMHEVEEFVVTRTVDAPRDLVWKVYSEAEHLMRWWGPAGSVMLSSRVDFRPGGVFHYSMAYQPGGEPLWGKFTYREINPQDSMVFTSSFSDEEGNTVRAPFSRHWPLEVMNRMTFEEHDGKTTITMRGVPYNATEEETALFVNMFDSMRGGFAGTLDRLEAYLAELSA